MNIEEMTMEYDKDGLAKKQKQQGGFDFSPLTSMLGNLVSSNPQMLLTMASSFFQGGNNNGGGGFSLDMLASALTDQFDLDTIISAASAFGGFSGGSDSTTGGGQRGEADKVKKVDFLNVSWSV